MRGSKCAFNAISSDVENLDWTKHSLNSRSFTWARMPLLTFRLHRLILTNLVRIPFDLSGEEKFIVNCPTKCCWRGEKKLRAKILEFFNQFHNSFKFCGLSTFSENNPNYHPGSSGILRPFAIDTITDPSKMINYACGVFYDF